MTAARHVRRWWMDAEGLTFRVLGERGQSLDGGQAVVLVHGIGMSHRYLSRLHEALAIDGAVFSVDLPGFAGLPKPPVDADIETMARGLGTVIAALDVGPVVLVGHSMGAQWAVEVGVQRPELIAHVVAMGPVVDDEHRSLMAQASALVIDSVGEPPSINAIVFSDYLRCGVRWYLKQARHMLRYRIDDRAALLTVPVLIIRGERDPIAGQDWCAELRDRAADGALVVVPGQHHVVQQTAPGGVASAIRAHTRARDHRW